MSDGREEKINGAIWRVADARKLLDSFEGDVIHASNCSEVPDELRDRMSDGIAAIGLALTEAAQAFYGTSLAHAPRLQRSPSAKR